MKYKSKKYYSYANRNEQDATIFGNELSEPPTLLLILCLTTSPPSTRPGALWYFHIIPACDPDTQAIK
jgi:hypothetical protein